MAIIDLQPDDTARIEAIAEMLHLSFAELSPGWLLTVSHAREKIAKSFEDGKLSRVLLTEGDEAVGWVGGEHLYGRLWELHPLVVSPDHRRRGFGRLLVEDLRRQVAARDGLTLHLSASDEADRTTLFGKDLYQDPLTALRELESTGEHPLDFYLSVGFTLVGLMPDAEGPGKPSIHFAMRV